MGRAARPEDGECANGQTAARRHVRHLFDWLVTGQVVAANPAASVRGPAHSVRRGKTPVFALLTRPGGLLDAIDVTTPAGLA